MSLNTGTGTMSGTPGYMSPQQARGKKPSHLDDAYSLGATIYDLISGKPPYFRGGMDTILMQVLSEPVSSDSERREELQITGKASIPEHWEQTFAACLSKEPAERPQSCGEMLARLRGSPPPVKPAPSLELVVTSPQAPAAPISEPRALVRVASPRMVRGRVVAPRRSRAWLLPLPIVSACALGVGVFAWIATTGGTRGRSGGLESTPKRESPAGSPKTTGEPLALPHVIATPAPSTPKPATPAPSTPAPAAKVLTPASTPKPPSETDKWLAQTDATYQAQYLREVVKPYEEGLAALQKIPSPPSTGQIASASRDARLNDALAFRNERQRIESGQGVPADDSDVPPIVLKTLRELFRKQSAQLENDWRKHTTAILKQFDQILATNQAALTQRQRLDEALLLQRRREVFAREWTPTPSASASCNLLRACGEFPGVRCFLRQTAKWRSLLA